MEEITDQKTWDDFVTSKSDYTFLQSWNWGEFQKTQGERVWRFKDVGQVVTVSARRGKFLFIPHGWGFNKELVNLAKREGYSFIRVSPWLEDTEKNRGLFKKFGFRPAPTMMHAEETWLVPIDKSEDEILAGMGKTHRNLIRRAIKDGVVIEKSDDVDILYDLQLEAARRHSFVPFLKKYLEQEVKVFGKNAVLFLGKWQGQTLSAALIVFYGRFAFYFQSGSKQTKVPVNYLLQWEVIKEAKKRGCIIYNMWGVSAENKGNAGGLYTFKSGFGGFQKNYLHAQDLVLSPKYYLTYILEKIPRRLRSLI